MYSLTIFEAADIIFVHCCEFLYIHANLLNECMLDFWPLWLAGSLKGSRSPTWRLPQSLRSRGPASSRWGGSVPGKNTPVLHLSHLSYTAHTWSKSFTLIVPHLSYTFHTWFILFIPVLHFVHLSYTVHIFLCIHHTFSVLSLPLLHFPQLSYSSCILYASSARLTPLLHLPQCDSVLSLQHPSFVLYTYSTLPLPCLTYLIHICSPLSPLVLHQAYLSCFIFNVKTSTCFWKSRWKLHQRA